jgi:hypothetical protein
MMIRGLGVRSHAPLASVHPSELVGRQKELNAALDLDKNAQQVAEPEPAEPEASPIIRMDGPGIADSAQIPVVGAGIDRGQILLFGGDGRVDAAAEVIYRFQRPLDRESQRMRGVAMASQPAASPGLGST